MLKDDEEKRAKINENLAEIDREFKGTTNVKHLAQILRDDVGFEKISSLIEQPLDLNVAVHYGCHFLKPTAEIGIEEQAENPSILDELVELTGAKSIDYKDKMMCCGAGGGVRARDLDVTASYTKEKLDHMSEAGVDAIVDVCPFCHMQFDQGQTEVNERYGTDFAIPVFHLAQLYGLAMGLSAEDLTLDAQKIDAAPALAKALGKNAK
jgi:heterodisulfide reductase subunit B